ncbi:class E sortase [Pseudonocardiaceae bacterium YIM PH 21723]|nr:class E sortase [Pseudonocardiaceae bacterium YIM PH 21723]
MTTMVLDRPAGLSAEVRRELQLIGQVLSIFALLLLAFAAQLTAIGALQHLRDQTTMFDEYRVTAADSRALTGPMDADRKLWPTGTPMAYLEIPKLGLSEVVGEGTSSEALSSGPGHRRDTVLPGQLGTSVIMGRRLAYGGPFQDLDELRAGDRFHVSTGQGRSEFQVIAVRRAGDPQPPAAAPGKGRLTLITTSGPALMPVDLLRVDAELTSETKATPPQIPAAALPAADKAMAHDSGALLPLVLWGQLLLVLAVLMVWARHRLGRWQAWVIGVPLLGAVGLLAADNAARLLPNLL